MKNIENMYKVTKKFKKKRCKFCKVQFTTNKKTEFCSDICAYDYKRVTLYKKFGRGPSYEYVCRALTVGNKTGDAFGITIPRELIDKHNLLGKKFKVNVTKNGMFIIKTKIEYTEIK